MLNGRSGPVRSGLRVAMYARPRLAAVVALAACLGTGSCKTSSEAAALAKQLAVTAADLNVLYSDLAKQVEEAVELNAINQAVTGLAFPDSDRATLTDIATEIGKRAALAQSLSSLASTYGNLASADASTDVSGAAAKLGTDLQGALQAVSVLPKHGGPSLPGPMEEAAKVLTDFVRTRELKTGARGIQKCVEGLDSLYRRELPIYNSLAKTRIATAEGIALTLIDRHEVDQGTALAPALLPFGLTPHVTTDHPPYAVVLTQQVKASAADQVKSFEQRTDAIGNALESEDLELSALVSGKKTGAPGHK